MAVIAAFRDDLDFLLVARDAVCVEVCHDSLAQRRGGAVDALELGIAGRIELDNDRFGLLVLQIGLQQADGRRDAWCHWHDHVSRRDRLRQRHAVQRPGSAKRQDRELAWVDATRHRIGADGERHVVVDDLDDPEGRVRYRQAERFGDLFLDRRH